jgi:hypothetical protein
MRTMFTVTIRDTSGGALSEHQARQEVADALRRIAQSIGDGKTTSDEVRDRAGRPCGSWEFTGARS